MTHRHLGLGISRPSYGASQGCRFRQWRVESCWCSGESGFDLFRPVEQWWLYVTICYYAAKLPYTTYTFCEPEKIMKSLHATVIKHGCKIPFQQRFIAGKCREYHLSAGFSCKPSSSVIPGKRQLLCGWEMCQNWERFRAAKSLDQRLSWGSPT